MITSSEAIGTRADDAGAGADRADAEQERDGRADRGDAVAERDGQRPDRRTGQDARRQAEQHAEHRRLPGDVDETVDEQRGADQPDDQKAGAPCSRLGVARGEQCQQCHDAAFAAVVRAQDQKRVFE